MEELEYNLLFRWFVGLSADEPVWVPTVFSKNRERLMAGEVARAFFREVGQLAREQGLMSDEHFTVDGTLIEAWASQKSKGSGRPHRPATPTPEIPASTFGVSRAVTTLINPPPTPRRAWLARGWGRRPNWLSWATC
jgi:hypothetical protein